jgi:hypothetical protein
MNAVRLRAQAPVMEVSRGQPVSSGPKPGVDTMADVVRALERGRTLVRKMGWTMATTAYIDLWLDFWTLAMPDDEDV